MTSERVNEGRVPASAAADAVAGTLTDKIVAAGGTPEGRVVVLDPSDGSGLAAHTVGQALSEGTRGLLLHGSGHPSERRYRFGVAMQLFDSVWLIDRDSDLFGGGGRLAGRLMAGELELHGDEDPEAFFPVIRSLTTVIQRLCAPRGDGSDGAVVISVDELSHVDGPSLHFLAYLAQRVEFLPLTIVLAGDHRDDSADPIALASLHARVQMSGQIRHVTPSNTAAAPPPAPRPSPTAGPAAPSPLSPATAPPTGEELTRMAVRAGLGDARSEVVRELVRDAWAAVTAAGRTSTCDWAATQLGRSLVVVDELELALEILRHPRAESADADRPVDAAGTELRAWTLFHQGRLLEAAAEVEPHPGKDGPPQDDHGRQAITAACLLHCGRLPEAARALRTLDEHTGRPGRALPFLLETRGQLHLAEHRPGDALRDALEAHRRGSSLDPHSIGPSSWRCIAARAHMALGRPDTARELAEEERTLAEARAIPRRRTAALRILAALAPAEAQVELLQRAVSSVDQAPQRLERLYALIDLGSVLRRSNQRREARLALTEALTLAQERGAEGAATRARDELAAAAGRRTQPREAGAAALTPSERRVATLAATGRSTRQIAADLFVTPKTVEFHLRHIYRKLEISSSRSELRRVMQPAPEERPTDGSAEVDSSTE